MNNIIKIRAMLADIPQKPALGVFFKTSKGSYAEHDVFIGVAVPMLRKVAKSFCDIALTEIEQLLQSKINEERLLALIILADQYKRGNAELKAQIYQFYISNLKYVNNWNLVDSSAHLIIGNHLFEQNREVLLNLAKSDILWERRTAIVSTWYFIRQSDLLWTFKIAKILLEDSHDLIHKAVGWMLREAGKKDQAALKKFLDEYASKMPRTMLRYAIEKFDPDVRQHYLKILPPKELR